MWIYTYSQRDHEMEQGDKRKTLIVSQKHAASQLFVTQHPRLPSLL